MEERDQKVSVVQGKESVRSLRICTTTITEHMESFVDSVVCLGLI